jgi:hypothetical protein
MELGLAVSADVDGGKSADLMFGQSEVHDIALHPCHGRDRDGDLLPPPQMATLEDDMRYVFVDVNYEAVDLAK